jgi:hypothetical protein
LSARNSMLIGIAASALPNTLLALENVRACFVEQVMAYEACRDVMEALRAKYSGPLQVG